MPRIDLGGMVGNGSNKLSGVSSNLDTQALVDFAVEAKSLPIKRLEEKIEIDNKKAEAFSELNKLLNDFKNSADKLRLSSAYGASATDVFSNKQIIASSSDGVLTDKYAVIASDNDVEINSFTMEVISTAKEKIQQSKAFASKTTSAVATFPVGNQFKAGVFQINGVDITLSDGDTLVEVASKINAVQKTANVKAQIIQPNSGEYRIILQATQTGVVNDIVFTDASNVINGLFDFDAVENPNDIIQAAADSQIKFNNFLVNRTTNTIDDFIDGITISLLKETPVDVSINVDIVDDKTASINEIVNFVTQYNAVLSFIDEQQERDAYGEYVETAVIQNNSLLNQIKSDLALLISGAPTGAMEFSTLSEIGIDYKDIESMMSDTKNKLALEINEEKFTSALENSFESLKQLFQYQYSSSSSQFILLERSNSLANASFTLDVDINRGDVAKVIINSAEVIADFQPFDSNDLTKGGYITGRDGTEFQGYKFVYSGSGVDTSDVGFTQGFGDKLYNQLDSYLSKNFQANVGGSSFMASQVDLEIYGLRDGVESSNKEIDKKQQLVDKYRESLVNKYSALEGAIAKANTIMGMLEAQQNNAGKK